MIAVFDIDGVLVDISHRMHYLKSKNYDKFYSQDELAKDEDIEEGIKLFRIMSRDCDTFFCTSRPELTRQSTERLLVRIVGDSIVGSLSDKLIMRKNGDYRQSCVVKTELIGNLIKEQENNPFGVDCSGFFVDDSFENTSSVSRAFPNIVGITFDKRKPKQNKKIMLI